MQLENSGCEAGDQLNINEVSHRSQVSISFDIQHGWEKLTSDDVAQVHTTGDLAAKVALRYGVSDAKALHDVQAWAQGRRF
jgi:hypothetical protein